MHRETVVVVSVKQSELIVFVIHIPAETSDPNKLQRNAESLRNEGKKTSRKNTKYKILRLCSSFLCAPKCIYTHATARTHSENLLQRKPEIIILILLILEQLRTQ